MVNKMFMYKKLFYLVLLLCVISGYWFLRLNAVPSSSFIEKNDESNRISKNYSLNHSAGSNQKESLATQKEGDAIKLGTPAWIKMYNEFLAWAEQSGYYLSSESSDYKSYSEETLISLAGNGDVKALMFLGEKVLANEGVKNASVYFEQAAVRGSIAAINNLGIFKEPSAAETFDSEEDKNKAYYETLAYAEVLNMRGDKWMAKTESDYLIDRRKLRLTDKDKEEINKIAKEIYNDLQFKRTQLGLGDFDNTVPVAYK